MIKDKIAPHIVDIVGWLQEAGFETYVVGGAVRDLILDRPPKDYDLSTAATPQEIRRVLGKKRTFMIGRRFQLIHYHYGRDIIEISTFRQAPGKDHQPEALKQKLDPLPEKLILRDNEFGNAEDDAWRRDFTVNAVFYDPIADKVVDFTGMGVDDMNNGIVRAIGEPAHRFEEDPVRMLRALKLVGQYDFRLCEKTEQALTASLELINHAAVSRLNLELEKILKNPYGEKILDTFHRYGFLERFLPFLDSEWKTDAGRYAFRLLEERNRRVRDEQYRDSISLAMAILTLPFIEKSYGSGVHGELWENQDAFGREVRKIIRMVFTPRDTTKRIIASAINMLLLQPKMRFSRRNPEKLFRHPGYPHARELLIIQNKISWNEPGIEEKWPFRKRSRRRRSGGRKRYRNKPRK